MWLRVGKGYPISQNKGITEGIYLTGSPQFYQVSTKTLVSQFYQGNWAKEITLQPVQVAEQRRAVALRLASTLAPTPNHTYSRKQYYKQDAFYNGQPKIRHYYLERVSNNDSRKLIYIKQLGNQLITGSLRTERYQCVKNGLCRQMDSNWKNRELIFCVLFVLALLIIWIIASNDPDPPSLPPWEDPWIDRPEPYDYGQQSLHTM